jgi:predicted acylesterase/phospholipase RssA
MLCMAHLPATKGFTTTSLVSNPSLLLRRVPVPVRSSSSSVVLQVLDTDKEAGTGTGTDKATPGDDVFGMNAFIPNVASGSFGNMLMQMQKKEEALIAANEPLTTLEEQAVDLSYPSNGSSSGNKDDNNNNNNDNNNNDGSSKKYAFLDSVLDKQKSQLASMNWETAKELDEAVTVLNGPRDGFYDNVKEVALPPLYQQVLRARGHAVADADGNIPTAHVEPHIPLSRPEHYKDRIGRDLRQLAVSITSSTENVGQWRAFCQEKGGIFPLLESVREGARSMQEETARSTVSESESFQAACSACRALRDICAVSPEVSVVVTDGILRANAAWKGALMDDICTVLVYVNEYTYDAATVTSVRRRHRRDGRLRCKLYVSQLLLAMTVASDDAVAAIRATEGLSSAVLASSSYAPKEQRRRWLRYPREMVKWIWRSKTRKNTGSLRKPFLEAANVSNDLNGQVQKTANQVLAAIGYNGWIPKSPGQKGLRILTLDGGGSRGMTAVSIVNCLVESLGSGAEVADSFDIVAGTSTGAIISFLVALRRETSASAVDRYNALVRRIFVKSALSTPMMIFTTATYDESPFMDILSDILQDESMLDSRADPAVPLVFAVTSKMSSTPTHVSLFRNYNYAEGELRDPFTIDPEVARKDTGILLELENNLVRSGKYGSSNAAAKSPGSKVSDDSRRPGSRYPGSFRVLQRYALRASTAAPTVFKPVMMGGEMYCDGGIVASNPAAVAIHEAKTLFPDIPIELVVSVGTGAFLEQKSAPRIGWDGIIGQIVNSATDGEQIHHVLEDVLGDTGVMSASSTRYFRFNPVLGMPDEFPIDVTDPIKLAKLKQIAREYMDEPEQREKLADIGDILNGKERWRKWFPRR